jgi:hypothetical protein
MGTEVGELAALTGDPVIDKTRTSVNNGAGNMADWKVISYSVAHYICASEFNDGNVWHLSISHV